MSRLQRGVSITNVVLATLLIAAAGYSGTAIQLQPAASKQQASSSPAPSPGARLLPSPSAESPASPPAPAGLYAMDQYMLDGSTGWKLVSDCPLRANPTCTFAVVKTLDGGNTWSAPVRVGPAFASTDGDAPRVIRFAGADDGFVYGHEAAFATHDGGATWGALRVRFVFVHSMAMAGGMVWLSIYPCSKGTTCQSEALSSADGGKTWSAPHQLEPGLSPEVASAFASGVLLSSPTSPMDSEMTTDRGLTWQTIKSPCPQPPYVSSITATGDGKKLWALCEAFQDASGQTAPASLNVSSDGGRTWSKPAPGTSFPAALLPSGRG